jgi:hypothetical protein
MEWVTYAVWVLIALIVAALIFFSGSRATLRIVKKLGGEQREPRLAPTPQGTQPPVQTAVPSPTPRGADGPTDSDDDIKHKALNKEYESVNIGGAILLLQTSPNTPEEEVAILFSQVTDEKA